MNRILSIFGLERKRKGDMFVQEYRRQQLNFHEKQRMKCWRDKIDRDIKQIRVDVTKMKKDSIKENNNLCSICMVNAADSAPGPCGHKKFCHNCLESYWRSSDHLGCPICRAEIVMIVKIFE